MGRTEILENGEPLTEIRLDRRLDDLAGRLRHKRPHAGELADLIDAASCTGLAHHVNRIEIGFSALVARRLVGAVGVTVIVAQLRHHRLRDQLAGVNPDVDHLVVSFQPSECALFERLLNAIDRLLRRVDDLLLGTRDAHVRHTDRKSCQRAVLEPDVLDGVEEIDRGRATQQLVTVCDDANQTLLRQRVVVVRHARRKNIVEDQPSDGRQHATMTRDRIETGLLAARHSFSVDADDDFLMNADALVVVSRHRLEYIRELGRIVLFDLGTDVIGRQVVHPHHDILCGRHDGTAVCGAENVVRRQHQHVSLRLCLDR